jgi:hypothetical protein
LNDDHQVLLRDALIIRVIVRGDLDGPFFNRSSHQIGERVGGDPRLRGGPRRTNQIRDKVVTGLAGVLVRVMIKIIDLDETLDDMNILVEVGGEDF